MKKIILITFILFLLTSCGGTRLPDPDMAFPESGPDPAIMEPTTAPE
ncbi:membrane lipoprotein lipid attachment site-containing protein [Patescibacteria group bacterium]|nr:membrane lipoprotein lipid attachment site-containing protein [Patescibacteria group bacterium]MBU1682447.1 membrane lipoprotein lipid attachment site-containing protein [Patescibacteria group bacterium]